MLPSTTMRAQRYRSLGRCIYCLCSEEHALGKHKDGLTEEHIIPLALSGTLIFEHAVCDTCKTLTGKPEQRALNAELLVPRLLLELKRRRADKKPPKSLPRAAWGNHLLSEGIGAFRVELTAAQYPPVFQLLMFPVAGLLAGEDRVDPSLHGIQLVTCDLGIRPRASYPAVTTRTKFGHTDYCYLLAKIAYSFAAAEVGVAAFDGEGIRSLLLGRRDDVFNWVGGLSRPEPPHRSALHHLCLRKRGEWLTVLVNLFASAGVPPYEIVVGRAAT